MSIKRLVFNSSAASGVAAPRSEDPKLIIRVITFELVQPTGWLKIKYPTRQYAMSSQPVVRS